MRSGRGRRTVHTVVTVHAVQAAPLACLQACVPGDDPGLGPEPAGCGWFESSRTLREGAEVCEHEVLDPIVNELPLAWWIEWAGLRAAARQP
jgi:hypothetical protein